VARNLSGNSGDYLSHVDVTALRVAFPISIGFWWKGTGHSNFTYIMSKVLLAGDHPSYGFSFNASGELRFLIGWGINPSDVTSTTGASGSGAVYDGNWHYVTGTYDGTTIWHYVDGVAMDSKPETRAIAYAALPLFLGSFDGSILGAAGVIAETSIWNVALSTDDIASLVKGIATTLVRPDKLVEYWPLVGTFSPEMDEVSTMDLTINGTVAAAEHTRIYQQTSSGSRKLVTAVAGAPSTAGRQFMPFFS
jgi:hypothetical protein